jgi:hypothetical protein
MTRPVMILLAAAIGLGASASPARAHHTYAFYYEVCTRITIEGRVDRIEWKAPHPLIGVTLDNGTMYLAEWSGLPNLVRQGVTAETLKPGDRLSITGSPLKPTDQIDPAYRWMVSNLDRNTISALVQIRRASDGWSWSLPGGTALPKECTK